MTGHLLFLYLVIIISAVFHEFAHGWMAFQLGDNTAKDAGRLTLNPLSHIDPIGTVIVPLLLMISGGIFIGWAKPVPYNPYNLSDRKYGNLKVAIVGPLTNFLIALVLGLFIRFLGPSLVFSDIVSVSFLKLLEIVVYVNIILGLFNLIPVPPLDGSKIFFDIFPGYARFISRMGFLGFFIAIFIGFLILPTLAQNIHYLILGNYFIG